MGEVHSGVFWFSWLVDFPTLPASPKIDGSTCDLCCEKIDLFGVEKRGSLIYDYTMIIL